MSVGISFHKLSALICLSFISSNLVSVSTNGLLFDSIAHLKNLVVLENELTESLQAYVASHKENLDKIKTFAETVRNSTDRVSATRDYEYVHNPLNAYAIIKRFKEGWRKIESFLTVGEQYGDFMNKVESNKARFPSENNEDLLGAIAAILRLQNTYNLTARSFVEGKVPGCPTASTMSADSCFEIAKEAYEGNQLRRSHEWLEECLRLVRRTTTRQGVSERQILDYLGWIEYLTGNVEKALQTTLELLKIAPDVRKFINNEAFYRATLERGWPKSAEQIKSEKEQINAEMFKNSTYVRLCQGKPTEITRSHQKLKCWYHGRRNPGLLLKPAKLEQINLEPRIYIFRDMLTHNEAERIKEIATPQLNRATVYNQDTGSLEYAEYRVSKSAWLDESLDEVVARVNRRASLVTGLDDRSAELLQVGNYGMGGQYEHHVDFGDPGTPIAKDFRGNRVATLLIYLNNVASGGATAFIEAGLHVPPTIGDAVFWYNLKRSGEGDYTTGHAGCPVLCGNKWVANKWYREYGNMFRRPCALDINL